MTHMIETKGAKRFLFVKEKDGLTQALGDLAEQSDEMPEVSVTEWSTLRDAVYECEVWVTNEPEGGFSAHAPRLPGVVAQGEDIDETVREMGRALSATIASYMELEGSIPWTDAPIEVVTEPLTTKSWILVNG